MNTPSQHETESPYRSRRIRNVDGNDVGTNVTVAGFVDRVRVLGGVCFLWLRDESGTLQAVAERGGTGFEVVTGLRVESVVSVTGEVRLRPSGAANEREERGGIELVVERVVVHSSAEPLPFPVTGPCKAPEALRLRHRYLDLRRRELRRNVELRSSVIGRLRELLQERGFVEVQTPILTASSPEGARDFLVPSRRHPGRCYALPQAPQIFKQLLMTAGFERYFQIAPCFRDEDARADRSPGEFYQLDFEMAFVDQEQVFATIEPVLHDVFVRFGRGQCAPPPFPRLPYQEAMLAYGSDKPDLRNPLRFVALSEEVNDAAREALGGEHGAVAATVGHPGDGEETILRALRISNGSSLSRRRMNALVSSSATGGARAAVLSVGGDAKGAFVRMPDGARQSLIAETGAEPGESVLVLFASASAWAGCVARLREALAGELGLVTHDEYRFLWVVDFPMYERDAETGAIGFSHNPFSMPQGGLEALSGEPLSVLAHQYDLVCNGVELSSGAIRNHRPDVMLRAFEIAGYSEDEVKRRFGGLYEAFSYGAPPHGGLAPGIDRILMLLTGARNLRDVIAFPMTQTAEDLMMGAPSVVDPEQLSELGIGQDHVPRVVDLDEETPTSPRAR